MVLFKRSPLLLGSHFAVIDFPVNIGLKERSLHDAFPTV